MDGLGPISLPASQFGPAPEALAVPVRPGDERSINAVASDFESMFLSLVMKEMRQTLEPGTLFGQDGSDVYGGLFDLYLGQHLARAGGFGIGAMVKRQFEASKTS